MKPTRLSIIRTSACATLVAALFTLPVNAQPNTNKTGPNPSASWKDKGEMHQAMAKDPRHASKLIGRTVKNMREESLGKVEDIIVDLGSGRVIAVVISSGGFLGMGDQLSVIPSRELRQEAGSDDLRLDASRESLSAAPRYTVGESPDFNAPAYSAYLGDTISRGEMQKDRVRDESYKKSGAAMDTTTRADNTERNVRDRDSATLDPLDQGNSRTDIDLTARIRAALVDRDGLSINAQNIKIISRDGQVTLRGPVRTEEEKRVVTRIATDAAGAARITNQLEVVSR